jgi:hypothetical protein
MSWQAIVATVADAVLTAVRGKAATPSAPPSLTITATGLSAFVSFVGPIVRIVEGKGTLTDDAAAANAVMDAIATFDPAALPVVTLIEMAEPAFGAIIGIAKSATITGGYPDIIGEENDRNFKNR